MVDVLKFDINKVFSNELSADKKTINIPRQVTEAAFSFVQCKVPTAPKLIHVNNELLHEWDAELTSKEEFIKVFSGSIPYQDFPSYAMCYGGHQFGHWAGQLGDGRAINIAEVLINGSNIKFQLKGAGPTPYSRTADGLAVLRSSIREYLCSEAMFHLGIPTTRALSLIETGDFVPRDILYNGNMRDEKGAIVCRVSESFIRFGSFEIFAARQDKVNLKKIVDYTIKHHYHHLGEPSKATYLAFFNEVSRRTKALIIHWQRVGFVHGVMNTDNMSILGQTIDYGPYGWLEDYDQDWTPNTTDAQGKRYRFGNQPNVALWNLTQLANALYPLIEEVEPLQQILHEFKVAYFEDYHRMMCAKLGLYNDDAVSDGFIFSLEKLMMDSELDMTMFFRELSEINDWSTKDFSELLYKVSYLDAFEDNLQQRWTAWFEKYFDVIQQENMNEEERSTKMKSFNPKYVLRNYMTQLAIEEAEKENYSLINELYTMLLNPYQDQEEFDKWYSKRPDWAKNKVGSSMLSCSS